MSCPIFYRRFREQVRPSDEGQEEETNEYRKYLSIATRNEYIKASRSRVVLRMKQPSFHAEPEFLQFTEFYRGRYYRGHRHCFNVLIHSIHDQHAKSKTCIYYIYQPKTTLFVLG